jgi:hypothetical protein
MITPTDGGTVDVFDSGSIDFDGHGTHVAGIIAARDNGFGVTGIAPEATVLPINVANALTADDLTAITAITEGVKAAVSHGANIISMSLALPADEANVIRPSTDSVDMHAALDSLCAQVGAAIDGGVVVVAAAGNDGYSGNLRNYPAVCPGVIVVSATTSDNTLASWSSYDSVVTLAAPGDNIVSTVRGATSTDLPYGMMSGTSMAAPLVAGVAALVKSAHPDYTPEQVRSALTSSATDLGQRGVDPYFGAGLVDAGAAVAGLPVRASIAPFTVLNVSARAATGSHPDAVTVGWSLSGVGEAPTSYSVTMQARSGDDVLSQTVTANQVRATFVLPSSWNDAGWATVTAHYADGSTRAGVPVFYLGRPNPLQHVVFSPPVITGSGKNEVYSYKVSWDPVAQTDADQIVLSLFSVSFHRELTSIPVARSSSTGQFPTSATITTRGVKPEKTVRLAQVDMRVSAYTVAGLDSDQTVLSPLATHLFTGSQALQPYYVDYGADSHTAYADMVVGQDFANTYCAAKTCVGHQVLVRIRTIRTVNGKDVVKIRTRKVAVVAFPDDVALADEKALSLPGLVSLVLPVAGSVSMIEINYVPVDSGRAGDTFQIFDRSTV